MIGMQAVLVAVLAVEEERLDASEFFSIVLLT